LLLIAPFFIKIYKWNTLEVDRFVFWIVINKDAMRAFVLLATGWGLGRAFDNGTFGGDFH
jgi:hypothetical protein